MRSLMRVSAYVLSCLVLMPGAGCGCKTGMKKFNVEIDLASNLRNKTVLVDLVGVSPANKDDWENKDLTEYWDENDRERFRATEALYLYKMEFKAGAASGRGTLSRTDPIWSTWKEKGVLWLFILAEMPASKARKSITLDSCWWDPSVQTIKVRINPARIIIDTSHLAEKRD